VLKANHLFVEACNSTRSGNRDLLLLPTKILLKFSTLFLQRVQIHVAPASQRMLGIRKRNPRNNKHNQRGAKIGNVQSKYRYSTVMRPYKVRYKYRVLALNAFDFIDKESPGGCHFVNSLSNNSRYGFDRPKGPKGEDEMHLVYFYHRMEDQILKF
jgi:hypothetical protein